MADVTGWRDRDFHNSESQYARFVTRGATLASGDSILLQDLPDQLPHSFLSVRMYDGAGAIVLGTGTFDITVRTVNNTQFEAPRDSSIDASAPLTVDWAGNTIEVRVTPDAGNAGYTSWDFVLTMNRT